MHQISILALKDHSQSKVTHQSHIVGLPARVVCERVQNKRLHMQTFPFSDALPSDQSVSVKEDEEIGDCITPSILQTTRTCLGYGMFNIVRQTEHPTLFSTTSFCYNATHTRATRQGVGLGYDQLACRALQRQMHMQGDRIAFTYTFVNPLFRTSNQHCTTRQFSIQRIPTKHRFAFCVDGVPPKSLCEMFKLPASATTKSTADAIPEPTHSQVHPVLPFLFQTSSSFSGPNISFFIVLTESVH